MKTGKRIAILSTVLIVLNSPWIFLLWCNKFFEWNLEWQPWISLLAIGATSAVVLVPYWFIRVIREKRWVTLGLIVIANGYFVIRCIAELMTNPLNEFGGFFLFTMILGWMLAASAIILAADAVIRSVIRIVTNKRARIEVL